MVGGPSTVSVTVPVEVLFARSSVVVSVALLFFVPAVVPVTSTLKVQLLLVESVAPERLMAPLLGVAVIVPPPQLPIRFEVDATVNPAGSVSVKPTPFKLDVALLLVMVKVRPVVPLS